MFGRLSLARDIRSTVDCTCVFPRNNRERRNKSYSEALLRLLYHIQMM